MNNINKDLYKSFINQLLKKLNPSNIDKQNNQYALDYYNNYGLKKFIETYQDSNYKINVWDSVSKILSNYNLYHYDKPEFIPLTLLDDYQILTGKNKKESVNDLYVPNISDTQYQLDVENQTNIYTLTNQKIIQSIISNKRTYKENINLINVFLLFVTNIVNLLSIANESKKINLVINKFNELLQDISNLELLDDDSIYFHTIKNKLIELIQDGLNDNDSFFSEYTIQYLLLSSSLLDEFKNIDFYLLYNEFIDENKLQLLNGEFDTDSLILSNIKNDNYYYNKDKVLSILKNKHTDFLSKMDDLLFDKNSVLDDTINSAVYVSLLSNYLKELEFVNNYLNNINLVNLIDYIKNEAVNTESIEVLKLILLLNVIPSVVNHDVLLMKVFEEKINTEIFDYHQNNSQVFEEYDEEMDYLDMKDVYNMDEMTMFTDTIPEEYHGSHVNNFITHNKELLGNDNIQYLLNSAIGKFNKDEYTQLKDVYNKLRGNCLVMGLKNLSEPFYLVEKLFEFKIATKDKLNTEEQKIINLININFNQMMDEFLAKSKYTIQTPVLKVKSLMDEATKYENKLSTFFLSENDLSMNTNMNDDVNNVLDYVTNNLDADNFEDNDLIDDINDVNTKDDNELLEHALSELMPENDLIQEEVTTSTEFEDVGRINEELDMSDLMTIQTEAYQERFNDEQDSNSLITKEYMDNESDKVTDFNEVESSSLDDFISDIPPLPEHFTSDINDDNQDVLFGEQDNDFLQSQNEEQIEHDISDNDENLLSDDNINDFNSENELEQFINEEELHNELEQVATIEQEVQQEEYVPSMNESENEQQFMNHVNNGDNINDVIKNNPTQTQIEQQVVYIEKPAQFIQTNGTIVFDSDRNGFIINNSCFLSANEWGSVVNNTKNNIETLWNYTQDLRNTFLNDGEAFIDQDMALPYVNNLIADMEEHNLFKTAAMLIRFKFYLLYLTSYQVSFDEDAYEIMVKVLTTINSLIIQNKQQSNHENFENIEALLEITISSLNANISHNIMQAKINEATDFILKSIKQTITPLIDNSNKIYESFTHFEKGFSRFTMQNGTILNKNTSLIETLNQNFNDLSSIVHAFHDDDVRRMKILNSNIKSVHTKVNDAIIQDSMHNQKGKGIVSRIFKGKPLESSEDDED